MSLPKMSLSREMFSRFEEAIRKEWLITNGLGGYASSTVVGVNTRKYHALLVASLHPPRDRRVFLLKLDEDVCVEKNVYRLGANEFQDGFYPHGFDFLSQFSVSPFPKYSYAMPKIQLQKTVFMPHGRNAVIILYAVNNRSGVEVNLRLFPILNCRSHHSVTDKSNSSLEFAQRREDAGVEVSLKPFQAVAMLKATEGRYVEQGKWVERMYLREEASRGESCFDDCFQPGCFETHVDPEESKSLAVVAVAGENEDGAREILAQLPSTTNDMDELCEKETSCVRNTLTNFYSTRKTIVSEDWLNWLVLAADSFLVQNQNDGHMAVIAGYHWFEAWGRDTFVSLPGLLLVTGKFEHAREVFESFKNHCKAGLIPNFLPEGTEVPAYNTVDATLWFVNATLQYLKYTGDFTFVKEHLWETLQSIIENHVHGADFGIRMEADGLLSHGPRLTWMDAAVGGKPVTPRAGQAVEVQALWYNALKTVHLLAKKFGDTAVAEKCAKIADKTKRSFVEKFWDKERNCLYDCVDQVWRDGSLRPNQVFAVALDFSMLDPQRQGRVVDVVERELLTSYGVRTLSINDPSYVGVYEGNRARRDGAYHNGTVWPWLLGPFTTAFLKTKGSTQSAREYALKTFLMPLFAQKISELGLGTLNEIFDGNPPYCSRGCISQAWSVAEPLRAYFENIKGERPKHEDEILALS